MKNVLRIEITTPDRNKVIAGWEIRPTPDHEFPYTLYKYFINPSRLSSQPDEIRAVPLSGEFKTFETAQEFLFTILTRHATDEEFDVVLDIPRILQRNLDVTDKSK